MITYNNYSTHTEAVLLSKTMAEMVKNGSVFNATNKKWSIINDSLYIDNRPIFLNTIHRTIPINSIDRVGQLAIITMNSYARHTIFVILSNDANPI